MSSAVAIKTHALPARRKLPGGEQCCERASPVGLPSIVVDILMVTMMSLVIADENLIVRMIRTTLSQFCFLASLISKPLRLWVRFFRTFTDEVFLGSADICS